MPWSTPVSDPGDLWWNPRIVISNKLLGNFDAAVLGTTLGDPQGKDVPSECSPATTAAPIPLAAMGSKYSESTEPGVIQRGGALASLFFPVFHSASALSEAFGCQSLQTGAQNVHFIMRPYLFFAMPAPCLLRLKGYLWFTNK